MDILQRFCIRQKVRLINDTVEWIDIAAFHRESDAWDAFDKAKAKSDDVALVKWIETQIA